MSSFRFTSLTVILSITALICLASSAPAEVKEHTEVITSNSHTFEIDVGGTMNPENLEIIIANDGPEPVANPRITVNGKYNWYTIKDMAAEITEGCTTEKEKAMAIFQFVEQQTYWWSYPKDRSSLNPVRHFNTYGYHICSQAACEFVALCRAAGLEARVYEIWHHTVSEAKWDGVWHHMDPDIGIWYLKDDNKTVASMAELDTNSGWVARTYKPYRWFITPGNNRKFIYKPETDPAGPGLALLYDTMDDNYVETGYDKWLYTEQTMDMTLRPGEKMVRWWKPVLRKHYDQKLTHEPPRYANGRIVFKPDFSKYTYDGFISRRNIAFKAEDGKMPVVHVDKLQDRVHDRASSLTIPMNSPYVMVGGYIDTKYYKGGTARLDRVSLAADLDPVQHRTSSLWNYYSWGYAGAESRAVLDDKMVKDGRVGSYSYRAMYTISADKSHENEPAVYPLIYGGQSGLDHVKLVADIQVNPSSLPALSRGKNVIKYSDQTDKPHSLKVTYKWREIDDQHVPDAPKSAASPKDGSRIRGLAPKLEWAASNDADGDKIVCYRVQLSLRSDCAWPLNTSFDRDVRSGTSFQAAEGWLNPGTTYYWRVKAEDSNGNWSDWSDIWSFSTR
ncbi:transglutaminase domain-containing protein [candidate division KSB1 bacterium]